MPTYARTNTPLARVNAREGQAYKEQLGKTELAIAGDGQGQVIVAAEDASSVNYGKVWIRLSKGHSNDSGAALTTPPIKALAHRDFYPADGMPIRVSVDQVTGMYKVEGNDTLLSAAAGVNVTGFNSQAPNRNSKWFRDIRNMRSFIPSTNSTSLTKISIEPYLYAWNGQLKYAEKGQADNIDLSSYIPTAGNERLVGVAIKATDNSVQIVQGSTRTISGAKWSLSDLQELYDQLDRDAMPVDVWRLSDAQANVRMSDRLFDWRQVLNVPSRMPVPQVITSTYTIPSGKDAWLVGPVAIDGAITITGEMTIL